jgi:hypothetical protein
VHHFKVNGRAKGDDLKKTIIFSCHINFEYNNILKIRGKK